VQLVACGGVERFESAEPSDGEDEGSRGVEERNRGKE
jgi:hypothetical protein